MSSIINDTNNPECVDANIPYFVPPAGGVRAYIKISTDPITGQRAANYSVKDHQIVIENVRGKEDQYSLDSTGFQFYNIPSKHKTFLNDDEIKAEYYPESEELYKKLTGASRIVIFDHTIRRRNPEQKGETPQTRQPALQAHVDQTTKASISRVHDHLPADEVEGLLKKRFQIINFWRPIKHAAFDRPLAVCDYRSVDTSKDLVEVSLMYPHKEGETYGVQYNPNHKWKYLRGMTPDEFVLIKCFDSIQDGSVAVFTPHTAFIDPSTPDDAPLRESIELRALVFYD